MNEIIIKNPRCIEPVEGFSTHIGHLIKMMNYARITTLHSVRNLTVEQLDFQFGETSNSVGALLSHFAATEKYFQAYTFQDREMTEEEIEAIEPAMDLGKLGREKIKGNPLEFYTDELKKVRNETYEEFAKRDDEWLFAPKEFRENDSMNNYFHWFHVLEDEINHRGQIRLICKMQGVV